MPRNFPMGDHSLPSANEVIPHWSDVELSIPTLYTSNTDTSSTSTSPSTSTFHDGNVYNPLCFWNAPPPLWPPPPLSLPPPPQQQYVTPTMHPNLVSTLKSLIDVEVGDLNPPLEAQSRDDIATVPVDLIQNRRPFRCAHDGCWKTFKNHQTLKMHHKSHFSESGGVLRMENELTGSGTRAGHNKKIPSKCPLCKKTFVGLYELRRHYGRKHTPGEKTHACRKCGKRFYIEVDLRDHEKLCGEPIECKCGMKFAFKCNLVAHKKTHPECRDPCPSFETISSDYSLFQQRMNIKTEDSYDVLDGPEGFAQMPSLQFEDDG